MDQTSHADLGGRSRLRVLAALSIAALASPGVLAWTASPVSAAVAYCDTFTQATAGTYFCEVPAGITTLDFVVAGGDGGSSYASGYDVGSHGHGARITGTISVTPGETLDIVVGGNGANGHGTGAGGGGYSSIAHDAVPLVVAGAGGGGGFNGGTGGSGTGGAAYDGGGWGGTSGEPGYYPNDAGSGGLASTGGGGGTSVISWSDDPEPTPTYDDAGTGGTYDSATESPNGGDAPADTHGGGGGAAFGGAGGLQDQTHATLYAAGASYGAGGNGGVDGGGGGGGYAGGGGGGGGAGPDGYAIRGGGGGGGSSLVPSGASVVLSAYGAIVTLSAPAPATTLYVVPDNQTLEYGQSFLGVYGFIISSTADGLTPIAASSLLNYTPPSCGSSYTSSTSVADSPLTISCGGGSNAGTAGSADGVTFDYTPTGSFTITKATLYVRPLPQELNVGAPVPGSSFYAYELYTDAARTVTFTGTPDVPPTCGSAYTATTMVDQPISCGGGSNHGTAGSDADYAFDYTDTTTLNVNPGPDLIVTLRVKGAVLILGISVTAEAGVATTVCSIDGADGVSCSNGWKSPALTKGDHTITVTVTDEGGLTDVYSGAFTIKSGKLR
jgi:hypothetical protein